jgi:O-acetyl-ADP-ribose deacetylase
MQMQLITGDITEQDVDVVVNAANSSLLGGGGVDAAIHRAGGPAILEECRRLRATSLPDGLPTGQAVATTAGDLPAGHVVHVVGPVHRRGSRDELLSCYRSALRLASELGAASIAFPTISAGVFGWPMDDAAAAAVEGVRSAGVELDEVRFVVFSRGAEAAFAAVLGRS